MKKHLNFVTCDYLVYPNVIIWYTELNIFEIHKYNFVSINLNISFLPNNKDITSILILFNMIFLCLYYFGMSYNDNMKYAVNL